MKNLTDLKDFAMILLGFVLFVAPIVVVMIEGMRCAGWKL